VTCSPSREIIVPSTEYFAHRTILATLPKQIVPTLLNLSHSRDCTLRRHTKTKPSCGLVSEPSSSTSGSRARVDSFLCFRRFVSHLFALRSPENFIWGKGGSSTRHGNPSKYVHTYPIQTPFGAGHSRLPGIEISRSSGPVTHFSRPLCVRGEL
jgi:hypothetical protein